MPRTETAKYMAGAYILQSIATNETTQKFGKSFADVLLNQLAIWAKDSPDLKKLVGDNHIDQDNHNKSAKSDSTSKEVKTSPQAESSNPVTSDDIAKTAQNVLETGTAIVQKTSESVKKSAESIKGAVDSVQLNSSTPKNESK